MTSSPTTPGTKRENMDECPDCGSIDLRYRTYGYYCFGCRTRHDLS